MICKRCGYCCIAYDVIVPMPSEKKNIVIGAHKPSNTLCWNLSFDAEGHAVCAIHSMPIYKKSPCNSHTQIEESNTVCRTGNWILDKGNEMILVEKKKCPVAVPCPRELKIK